MKAAMLYKLWMRVVVVMVSLFPVHMKYCGIGVCLQAIIIIRKSDNMGRGGTKAHIQWLARFDKQFIVQNVSVRLPLRSNFLSSNIHPFCTVLTIKREDIVLYCIAI